MSSSGAALLHHPLQKQEEISFKGLKTGRNASKTQVLCTNLGTGVPHTVWREATSQELYKNQDTRGCEEFVRHCSNQQKQMTIETTSMYCDGNNAIPTKYKSGRSRCIRNGKSNDRTREAQWDNGITWGVWDSDELNWRVKLKNLRRCHGDVRRICWTGF